MKFLPGILLLYVATAAMGGASAPTSRPIRNVPPVELSPLGWLRVYNDAMLSGDKDDLMNRSYASNENSRRLAAAVTAHDALVGKILKLAKERFDDKAARLLGRSLGDIGNDDLANAGTTVDGDHAVVRSGLGETHLILQNGQWKLDFDQSLEQRGRFAENIDEILANLAEKTANAESLHQAMVAGEVKTLDDALLLVRRNRLQ